MAAIIDTSSTVTIDRDRGKLALLLLVVLVFLAGSIWIVTGDFSRTHRAGAGLFMGWVGIVFCTAVAGLFAWRLVKGGTVFVLSAAGIAIAQTGELIPWAAVTAVDEMRAKNAKYVELSLTSEFAAQRKLKRKPWLSDSSKVSMSSQTFNLSHRELLDLVQGYVRDHGNPRAAAPSNPFSSIRLVR